MVSREGPFFFVAENAPKVAIFTAIFYIIVTYINIISHNWLGGQIQTIATDVMIVGALFCLPLAVFDIVFTGLNKPDLIMMGFINYFALLTEYVRSNWAQLKSVVYWVMYIYLALFVIALVYITIGYVVWRERKKRAKA